MTAVVYVGPRCPFHSAARTPGGSCEVCCFDVGNEVDPCGSCGYTSCPGCTLTLSERGVVNPDVTGSAHDVPREGLTGDLSAGAVSRAPLSLNATKSGPAHRSDPSYGGVEGGASSSSPGPRCVDRGQHVLRATAAGPTAGAA